MRLSNLVRSGALITSVLLLSACGGGTSGIDGPGAELVLKGAIADPAFADATVVVGIGDYRTEARADGDGRFSVDLAGIPADRSRIVSIFATADGAPSVRLASYLGSATELLAQAGTDGILDVTGNMRLVPTPISTAEAAIIDAGDALSTLTGETLDRKRYSLDFDAVIDVATALDLIIHNPAYALPQNTADTFAFAGDADSRKAYVQDLKRNHADDWSAARLTVVQQQAAFGTFTPADVPSQLLVANVPQLAYEVSTQLSTPLGLSFASGGTGSVYDNHFHSATSWSLDATGYLVSEPADPDAFEFSEYVDCESYGASLYLTVTGEYIRYRIAALGPRHVVVFRDIRETSQCPSSPVRYSADMVVYTRLSDDDFEPAASVAFADRTVSVPVYTDASNHRSLHVAPNLLSFYANGTGTGLLFNDAFAWTFAAGRLQITFANGAQAAYRKLRTQVTDEATLWLAEIRQGQQQYADFGLFFESGDWTFAEQDVPGTYFQFGYGDETNPQDPVQGFTLNFAADHGGYYSDDTYYERPDGVRYLQRTGNRPEDQIHWTLESPTTLVAIRTWIYATDQYDCNLETDADCVIYDRREIHPMRSDGDGVVWFEIRTYAQDSPEGVGPTSLPHYTQARYYDRSPLLPPPVQRKLRPYRPSHPPPRLQMVGYRPAANGGNPSAP
ncbi:MAG: hypothetical protein PHP86_14625 [Nevskiales bacterium]|nr:hypothetical protein [Nevskiales bacterium]